MENIKILKYFLPKEFVEYFTLIKVESQTKSIVFHLEENFVKPPEHQDKELESKGFSAPTILYDFPVRDKGAILKVRRRKWKDKETGKVYSRNWELKAQGTSYTKEFAAFLKEFHR